MCSLSIYGLHGVFVRGLADVVANLNEGRLKIGRRQCRNDPLRTVAVKAGSASCFTYRRLAVARIDAARFGFESTSPLIQHLLSLYFIFYIHYALPSKAWVMQGDPTIWSGRYFAKIFL